MVKATVKATDNMSGVILVLEERQDGMLLFYAGCCCRSLLSEKTPHGKSCARSAEGSTSSVTDGHCCSAAAIIASELERGAAAAVDCCSRGWMTITKESLYLWEVEQKQMFPRGSYAKKSPLQFLNNQVF